VTPGGGDASEAPGAGRTPGDLTPPALRPWQRLGVKLAAAFALLTLLTVGLVGALVHERQKHEVEDTVGTQLLNIARTAVLLVDPALHAEVQSTLSRESPAYQRLRKSLAAVQTETLLTTPIRTLADFDPTKRSARLVVAGDGSGRPGEPVALAPELIEPLGWTLEDGVARYTRIYRNATGTWITALAPIVDARGRAIAVLSIDYAVDLYFDRLRELQTTIVQASVAGALAALLLGLLAARRLTRPIGALTEGVARVAAGDLSRELPVRSRDEIGQLTRAFNEMVGGLRQRDFIRHAFGRYVSPEVAKTLLESPEGLRLGGHKREVTVLMSDLRGYTRFAEQGDPARVMEVLNGYLSRMADIVIAHGGTINEFIGDAIFAVFGAPLDHPDHAERAAAAALAMQAAMDGLNRDNAGRGWPRFEMGIGVNTGEAVVGNIGSEQRAKYAVVGAAVNLAARVEGCTVGGQIFVTTATLERVRNLAEVGEPVRVELKGIAEPVLLYELRAIGGRFAQRLPAQSADGDPHVQVRLPLRGWVVEGKQLGGEFAGTVTRLGRRSFDAALETGLAPLTNVKLRLSSPELGQESGDLYGKVVGVAGESAGRVTTIRLTSVDPADQKLLEMLLPPEGPGVSPRPA
jgi:class 3 adenylate cyclase